jgi:protein gp37
MNRTKIEWCINPDGTKGLTWNPVTGCLHPCRNNYCYANTIAIRFDGGHGAATGAIHVADAGMPPFPFRFDPTFYPKRLDEPKMRKKPSTIFAGSMADLFGAWVPAEWIESVLETVRACPQHRFIFLTKNSARYNEFALPDNCWAGVTLTGEGTVREAAMLQSLISAVPHRRYVSIEPLRARLDDSIIGMLSGVDRVIIGAQTGPGSKAHKPARGWITEIVAAADAAEVPVFLKRSLEPILNTGAGANEPGDNAAGFDVWHEPLVA